MKKKEAPVTEFESIEPAQLEQIVGGCACGCGMPNCSCTNGSYRTGTAAPRYSSPFGFGAR
jgi:hypothetical protein